MQKKIITTMLSVAMTIACSGLMAAQVYAVTPTTTTTLPPSSTTKTTTPTPTKTPSTTTTTDTPATTNDTSGCADAKSCIQSAVTSTDPGATSDDLPALIKKIVQVLLFILGGVAVLMIVIGGIRYALSQGDSGAISSAKNTILYAVIGLIVAIMAYAIVSFVITSFTKSSSDTSKST